MLGDGDGDGDDGDDDDDDNDADDDDLSIFGPRFFQIFDFSNCRKFEILNFLIFGGWRPTFWGGLGERSPPRKAFLVSPRNQRWDSV